MAYQPLPIGNQVMASAVGVTISSNQSPISVLATITGNPSISGTVLSNLQSTNASVITVSQSSIAVAIVSGSIAATFTPPANQSVSGMVGASIIGQLPTGTAMIGSVVAYQGVIPWTIGSIYGNISGSVAATITNTNVNVSGSVVGFQGTVPFITNFQNSSILAVPVGSVITVLQAPSIVGTYAEDAASASGDKGFLVMGARNDTLASVTSADGDYSSHVVGPSGELIAANAPFTKWVSGTASMLGGTPTTGSLVPIIPAQGSSIFTYITGVQIANASGTNAWITLFGATNSVVGYTVAPANGGSNIYFQNGLKTNANAAFSASVSAVSSVYLSAQGFISKT